MVFEAATEYSRTLGIERRGYGVACETLDALSVKLELDGAERSIASPGRGSMRDLP